MRIIRLFYIITLLCTASWMYGQTGTIRGNVYDKATGEPIGFANVHIQNTTHGTSSQMNGFYSIANIEPGEHTLICTFLGYDSLAANVTLTDNGILYQSFYLAESEGVNLGVVDITARRDEVTNEVKVSEVTLTTKELKALPSTGGEADIAQYLPVLPGIISSGDQGGQIYIRGGSPVQNKINLDGVTIYNPFHSIGFFSVFETEAVRSIDVSTGGFNAEEGGRLSAVVDINTKDGNKRKFSGVIGLNPFLGKIVLEGPLVKLNDDGSNLSLSYLLAGKYSIINKTSPSLYSYVPQGRIPFEFGDYYGKISLNSPNGSRVTLSGFDFNDFVDYPDIAKLDWTTYGGAMNYSLIPANSKAVIHGNIGFSNYKTSIQDDTTSTVPRSSGVNGFNASINLSNYQANGEVTYGLQLNGFSTNFSFENRFKQLVEQKENTTEIAGYVKVRHKWGNFIIDPGIRLHYYTSLSEFSLEPRLGLKYNITDYLRIKAAGGRYTQNLVSSVREQDVVNLFVGFLSGPETDVFDPETGQPVDQRIQVAYHAIGGVEWDITPQLTLNVEPYLKEFTQLFSLNREKLAASDPNFQVETGRAVGLDISASYTNKGLYLWGTYSLGKVTRYDGVQTYPTIFDRRHNMNLLLSYSFGKRNSWETSLRFNFGSGFPFTQTQGFYDQLPVADDAVNFDPNTSNGDIGVIYSDERNGGRLPDYNRLDVSLKKTFYFGKHLSLEMIGSITNAYDRSNIFYFDRINYERVDQLPILPSLGANFKF